MARTATRARRPATTTATITAIGLASLLVACGRGTDLAAKAEAHITDQTAAQLGLGPLTADCPRPARTDIGTRFACTAATAEGRTVLIDVLIGVDEVLTVSATNVITAADVELLEERAVALLAEQTELVVERAGFDCGATSVIIDVEAEVLACTYTDPATGELHDATIDLPDLADLGTFTVDVVNEPRS